MANYRVGDKTFSRKHDIQAEVARILNEEPIGSVVAARDEAFLRALLDCRREKLNEIGARAVVGFVRGMQDGAVKHTRCFWVVLDDGSRLDFSVYKAINLLKPAQAVTADN